MPNRARVTKRESSSHSELKNRGDVVSAIKREFTQDDYADTKDIWWGIVDRAKSLYMLLIESYIGEADDDRQDSFLALMNRVIDRLKQPVSGAEFYAINSLIVNFDELYALNPNYFLSDNLDVSSADALERERSATIERLRAEKADLQKIISAQRDEINRQATEITNLNVRLRHEFSRVAARISTVLDPKKEPTYHTFAMSIAMTDEREQRNRLERVFASFPKYNGVRIDGPALEFFEQHWRMWVLLGWATRADVRTHTGSAFLVQLGREAERANLSLDELLPTLWSALDRKRARLTDEQLRHASTLIRKRYQK